MFWHLAERRIDDAVQRGLLDDLPGRGKPLQLDLYEDVPPELRAAYSILRAAGCLPEELERRRHRVRLEQLLAACVDDAAGADLRRQLLHARLAEAIAGERAHTH